MKRDERSQARPARFFSVKSTDYCDKLQTFLGEKQSFAVS